MTAKRRVVVSTRPSRCLGMNVPAEPLHIVVRPAEIIHGPPEAYKNESVPRGLIVIANWNEFDNVQKKRDGSLKDVENTTGLFSQIGYFICRILKDVQKEELFGYLREVRDKFILENLDSFVCVCMSHGRRNAFAMRNGEFVDTEDIIDEFDPSTFPALEKKPKLFIFQHCRGERKTLLDPSLPPDVSSDSRHSDIDSRGYGQTQYRVLGIPNAFIIFSTLPRYVSYRHKVRGGPFIEELCRTFMDHAKDKNIIELVAMVNKQLQRTIYNQRCDLNLRIQEPWHFYLNPLGPPSGAEALQSGEEVIPMETEDVPAKAEIMEMETDMLSPPEEAPGNVQLSEGKQKTSFKEKGSTSLSACGFEDDNCSEGTVFMINHLEGCEDDVQKISDLFAQMKYRIQPLEIASIKELKQNVQDIDREGQRTLVIFFFGYGFEDYIYIDRDDKESVSCREFCKMSSLMETNGVSIVVFTNTCFRRKMAETTLIPDSDDVAENTFHLSVKVNGQCEEGSLLTRALLNEFQSDKKLDFFRLATGVASTVRMIQEKEECRDVYITDIWYYGVSRPFYFTGHLPQSQEETEDEGFPADSEADVKEFLDKLGLTEYLGDTNKISWQKVMKYSSGKRNSVKDIPWYVLLKILMLDHRGRDDIVSQNIREVLSATGIKKVDSDEPPDDYEEIFSENPDGTCLMPHPMDVLNAIMLCSTNFLRQILCEKLFMCKLSIPLVMPSVLRKKPLFLLWSLRSTVAKFRLPDGNFFESSVIKHPMPIVSFLRLGEISRPKSKFLNEILNDQSHPTFFHEDCPNGRNRRVLSEGALEIAWFFPSHQHSDVDSLNRKIAFINLRGDGKSAKAVKTVEFLCKVSSITVVMIEINGVIDLDQSIAELRSKSLYNDSKLILMLTRQTPVKLDEKVKKELKTTIALLQSQGFQENIIFDFDARGKTDIKYLKREVGTLINKYLDERSEERAIEDWKEAAESLQISIDEDIPECSESNKEALKLVREICTGGLSNLKPRILPLQCKPWQEWAKSDKEEHRREKRGTDDMTRYMDKMFNHKKEYRRQQLHLIEKPNILCNGFLDKFSDSVREESLYFLKYLKLNLDELSRKSLPSLQQQFSTIWNEIRSCDDTDKVATLTAKLEETEKELAASSFGLEHFMREVAQAYESTEDMKNEASTKIKEEFQDLPTVMAKLMLLGYPLEIMDGDAAHIPLRWVQAVFAQLSNFIGDKKMFVLSVLGIQSSGKSTLLNTMFGIQFAVATGRCTRGVFAQLLPICTDYSCAGYDYILVIDTEGLGAAELGKEKLQHDNEIVTLVVGLGDVTIVNVKGENIFAMGDLLHVIVHALLKMKLVNNNLKLQPSCIFVHRDVSAEHASQRLRSCQENFIDSLDEVAKAAGKQEDAPQYTKFSEIVEFDINKNIWYVTDLWKGDPPMAPVNPGYSESINKIKHNLLTDVMQNRSLQLTANKFVKRLEDLWNGILEQDFVFSFRNSLEIDSYNSLERELADILWLIKSRSGAWFSNKINLIENREKEIENFSLVLESECKNNLEVEFQEAKRKLENFFSDNENRSILEQWRVNSMIRLEADCEKILNATFADIRHEIEKKKIRIEQKKDMKIFKNRIMDDAKKLADKLRPQEGERERSDEELSQIFQSKWDDWMEMIPHKERVTLNVKEKVYDVLENQIFKADKSYFRAIKEERYEEILRYNCIGAIAKYTTGREWLSLRGIINYLSFNKEGEIAEKHVKELMKTVKHIGTVMNCQEQCVPLIMETVSDSVKKMTDVLKFFNSDELEVCLALFVCQYVSLSFPRIFKLERESTADCKLTEYDIHPCLEKALLEKFSHLAKTVIPKIKAELLLQRSSRNFIFDIEKHTQNVKKNKSCNIQQNVQMSIDALFDKVLSYSEDIQFFTENHIEEIARMESDMEKQYEKVTFTKSFRIKLTLYLCHFCLPKFIEKHKRFVEERDQRFVYERDNYRPCYERFKNFYHKFTTEQAFASVLSERVCKSIAHNVNINMARSLAEDIRNNVQQLQLKSTFLKSVLLKFLEVDRFEEFFLYLTDLNACLEKWLHYFISKYIFTKKTNGINRYTEIAFLKVESLTSNVCEEIIRKNVNSSENSLNAWIRDFHSRVTERLPLPLEDLLSLSEGYDIVSMESFTEHFRGEVQNHQEKIKDFFKNHGPNDHKASQENNVYKMFATECKGCTERCPFCSAPCSLNDSGHTGNNVNHAALEHYPQACSGWHETISEKLVIETCPVKVAGDITFRHRKTNEEYRPYKEYKKYFPDWNIPGDSSVQASPYWKWFLVKYESRLAEAFGVERPDDIPSSWRSITKDDARNSVTF